MNTICNGNYEYCKKYLHGAKVSAMLCGGKYRFYLFKRLRTFYLQESRFTQAGAGAVVVLILLKRQPNNTTSINHGELSENLLIVA